MNKRRVFHIITSLGVGGAERSLYKILSSTTEDFDHIVVSLTGDGYFGQELRKQSIAVFALQGQRPGFFQFSFRLIVVLRLFLKFRPHVIDCWMPHSCLFGSLLKCFSPSSRLLWNLRNQPESPTYKKSLRLAFFIMNILSPLPDKIVYNSYRAFYKTKSFWIRDLGNKMVIHNGFADPVLRHSCPITQRVLLGLPYGAFVCISVARYHPSKNHSLCVKSFIEASMINPNLYFVFAGRGVHEGCFPVLLKQPLDIRNRFFFLGEINRLDQLYKRADLFVQCSVTEGFPNTLAEAMLNRTVCIASDVGDSSYIMGNTGILLKEVTASSVSKSILFYSTMSQEEIAIHREQARKQILDNFSLSSNVRSFCELYRFN